VEHVDDLAQPAGNQPTGNQPTGDLPATDGLRLRLAGNGRVVVRPSGTEPKIKCYLEVVVPVDDSPGAVDAARIAASGRLDAIRGDLAHAAGL
jgi:phosphomannomutase